jgi:hypothetical protein
MNGAAISIALLLTVAAGGSIHAHRREGHPYRLGVAVIVLELVVATLALILGVV